MRSRLWLVCCVLARLPLRGWAVAANAMPAPTPAHAPGAMPCDGTHDETDAAGGSRACQPCDPCHRGAATAPAALGALPDRFADAPRPIPSATPLGAS
jgi:hypothetical protein